MASGRLGAEDLAADTNTVVYTVPADVVATVNIYLCNRNPTPVIIRLAHLNGGIGTFANEDYIDYGVTIPANGVLERTGIVMAVAATIVARSDTTSVTVQVAGWEEPI